MEDGIRWWASSDGSRNLPAHLCERLVHLRPSVGTPRPARSPCGLPRAQGVLAQRRPCSSPNRRPPRAVILRL